MKQRVSIVRALANDPEVLLMDEPLGALDAQTRIVLQDELLRIWEETRKTVVYITHSLDEAILLGDRVILMTAHPGRHLATFHIDIERPRTVETINTARFAELRGAIWDLLAKEVARAMADAGMTRIAECGRGRERPECSRCGGRCATRFAAARLLDRRVVAGRGAHRLERRILRLRPLVHPVVARSARRFRAGGPDRRTGRPRRAAAAASDLRKSRWHSASRFWRSLPGS